MIKSILRIHAKYSRPINYLYDSSGDRLDQG